MILSLTDSLDKQFMPSPLTLANAGLIVNIDKCQLRKAHLKDLGLQVPEGCVEALQNYRQPYFKAFSRLVSCYRRFISHLAADTSTYTALFSKACGGHLPGRLFTYM